MFMMRFDMRAPDTGAPINDLYRAAVEMAEWAETRGCIAVMISQHHASPDNYIPSPLLLASAIAARTTKLPITIGALLVNFYDPVKLAEDIAVLDILSNGRMSYTIGLGYRPEEYAMFGVDMKRRGRVIEEKISVIQRALAGEVFDYQGRTVNVRPLPTSPQVSFGYGGHALAAARRAGRMGLNFFAEGGTEELMEAYQQAARDAGREPGFAYIPSTANPTSVFLAEDVDEAWEQYGPYLLHDAVIYREWFGEDSAAASQSHATTVEELRAENGAYRIFTVDEAADRVAAGMPLSMQPLCGGLPPELAWKSVHLAGTKLQEALAARAK